MTRLIRSTVAVVAGLTLSAGVLPGGVWGAAAEPVTFGFEDPKGVNGIVFVLDSPLEPIAGMIGGVGGTVSYDPADPASFTGQITVDLAELSFTNSKMTEVLKGADWLNFGDSFIATLEFTGVQSVEGEGQEKSLVVDGMMKFGANEVPMTVTIDVTYLPDGAEARGGAKSGDLLVLRSMFTLSRLDLGINPEMPTDKVGETMTVMVPIVGYSK